MRKRLLQIAFLLAALIALITIPHPSFAEKLALTREVFLEKGKTAKANVIVRTHDNGFVIAGAMNGDKALWATRTDSEGNVKWRYLDPSPDQSRHAPLPAYNSAAVMPDDSVFLCGGMTGPKGGAFLTHLDKDGKVLSEQPVLSVDERGNGPISSCMAWQNGVALVGITATDTQVKPSLDHPSPIDTEWYYWIALVDQNGKTEWEKLVPIPALELGAPSFISPLQATPDGGFVFTAFKFGTNVLRIGPDGNVQARNYFKDQLLTLARPTSGDGAIKLITTSTNLGNGAAPVSLITLNNMLQETGRIAETHDPGPIKQAYILPDQSLMLFGGLWPPPYGSSWAYVTWLDPSLTHEAALNLAKSDTSSWVDAAVPLSTPGEFACVRGAMDTVKLKTARTEEERAEVSLGVALDFVSLKPPN